MPHITVPLCERCSCLPCNCKITTNWYCQCGVILNSRTALTHECELEKEKP